MQITVSVTLSISDRPLGLRANFMYLDSEDKIYGEGYKILVRKGVEKSMQRFRKEVMYYANNDEKVIEAIENDVKEKIHDDLGKTDEEVVKDLKIKLQDSGFQFTIDI